MQEGVTEVDEARLHHVTVGMGVVAVILNVAAMIAQHAPLQKFAVMSEMSMLVAPAASICYLPIISDPCLTDKPFAIQNFCGSESTCLSILQDKGTLNHPPQSPIPIGLCDTM
jgi:hypothetical protein